MIARQSVLGIKRSWYSFMGGKPVKIVSLLKRSLRRKKDKIAVFPLIRLTLFQTPDYATFLSVKMQNKKSKAPTLNKIPVFS